MITVYIPFLMCIYIYGLVPVRKFLAFFYMRNVFIDSPRCTSLGMDYVCLKNQQYHVTKDMGFEIPEDKW